MKDAKGHGSDGRGALDTRLNRYVLSGTSAATRQEWMGNGHPRSDLDAAKELGQNRPHAAPPVTHPAFGRRA